MNAHYSCSFGEKGECFSLAVQHSPSHCTLDCLCLPLEVLQCFCVQNYGCSTNSSKIKPALRETQVKSANHLKKIKKITL